MMDARKRRASRASSEELSTSGGEGPAVLLPAFRVTVGFFALIIRSGVAVGFFGRIEQEARATPDTGGWVHDRWKRRCAVLACGSCL
jgi:hypothetical protein